jgi:D-3-phosphoglycerate dehydrogenase
MQETNSMKILVISPIDRDAIRQLSLWHDVRCEFKATDADLPALLEDREVLVFRSGVKVSADVMEAAPELRFLVRAGSGSDNVDVDYLRRRGLQLVRIPEPGAKAVAEMAFTFMLALARELLRADRLWRQGRWAKYDLNGYSLTGKVLGVVGAGNIGSRVGQLGAAWGMQAIGCVAHPSPTVAASLAEKGVRLADFDEVLTTADFLSLHVPLNSTTANLIDAKALARMKPGAFLVNLARGGVVDEEALYDALTQGSLRGAALDVHKQEGEGKISPLAGLENVILTPHIGASTVDAQREIGQRIVSIINSFVSEPVHPAVAGL